MKKEFWKTKPLSEMNRIEWESLCDGCGHCCLVKLQDEDTDELFFTNVSCHQLDLASCRCKDYAHRMQRVPMCAQITVEALPEFHWLPETCAYRLLSAGEDLPDWHPLVSGQDQSVREAGISVCAFAQSEEFIHPDQLHEHIIEDSDN